MGAWIMWINKDKNTTSILTQNKTLLSNPPLLSLYAFLFSNATIGYYFSLQSKKPGCIFTGSNEFCKA